MHLKKFNEERIGQSYYILEDHDYLRYCIMHLSHLLLDFNYFLLIWTCVMCAHHIVVGLLWFIMNKVKGKSKRVFLWYILKNGAIKMYLILWGILWKFDNVTKILLRKNERKITYCAALWLEYFPLFRWKYGHN